MNNQLSHDALTIYLRNLRTLEYIKYECNESIQKINNKNNSLRNRLYDKEKYMPDKVSKPRQPQTSDLIVSIVGFLIVAVMITCLVSVCLLPIMFFKGDSKFVKFVISILIGIAVIISIKRIISIIKNYEKEKENYEKQLRYYQDKMRDYQDKLRKRDNDIIQLQNKVDKFKSESKKRINEINKYIEHINSMLEKSYGLDIIPLQFRGIYGITYLYDFISSSNLSLSDAVINCNLEQIKDKLDVIINKCDEIIRQQKSTNANLREIQRQNNQLLAESKKISNNTALAAQYSKIAAENSAVSLELQKKQLAYQEVDSWLNKV